VRGSSTPRSWAPFSGDEMLDATIDDDRESFIVD
jgi:hypothetical protein